MDPQQIHVIPFEERDLKRVSYDDALFNSTEQVDGLNVIQRLFVKKMPLQCYTLVVQIDGTHTYCNSAGKVMHINQSTRPIKAVIQWAPRLDLRAARCDSPFDAWSDNRG
jgi:hypothetical protein